MKFKSWFGRIGCNVVDVSPLVR